jgi:hypothetical protein
MGRKIATAAFLAFLAFAPGVLLRGGEVPISKETINKTEVTDSRRQVSARRIEDVIKEFLKEKKIILRTEIINQDANLARHEFDLRKDFSDPESGLKNMNANIKINEYGKLNNIAMSITHDNAGFGVLYDNINNNCRMQGNFKNNKTTVSWATNDFKNLYLGLNTQINKNLAASTSYDIKSRQLILSMSAQYDNLKITATHDTAPLSQRTTLAANYTIPRLIDNINFTYNRLNGMDYFSAALNKKIKNTNVECGACMLNKQCIPYFKIIYSGRF